jgi:hypothetical protein
MGQRVDWTEAETKDFAAKVFAKWKEKPFENLTTLGKHIMAHDWPQHRRRPINAISPTGFKEVYRECARMIRETFDRAEQAATEANTPPAPEFIYLDRPVAPDPAAFMAAQPLETLLLELAHRLLKRWEALDQLKDAVERLEAQAKNNGKQPHNHYSVPAPVPISIATPRDGRRRIGIVGLFKDQFTHVQEKVADKVEVVFMDKDQTTASIPPTVSEVIVQKHCRHFWFEEAQKRCGNSHVHFVDGGQTAVVQKVFDILSRQ